MPQMRYQVGQPTSVAHRRHSLITMELPLVLPMFSCKTQMEVIPRFKKNILSSFGGNLIRHKARFGRTQRRLGRPGRFLYRRNRWFFGVALAGCKPRSTASCLPSIPSATPPTTRFMVRTFPHTPGRPGNYCSPVCLTTTVLADQRRWTTSNSPARPSPSRLGWRWRHWVVCFLSQPKGGGVRNCLEIYFTFGGNAQGLHHIFRPTEIHLFQN